MRFATTPLAMMRFAMQASPWSHFRYCTGSVRWALLGTLGLLSPSLLYAQAGQKVRDRGTSSVQYQQGTRETPLTRRTSITIEGFPLREALRTLGTSAAVKLTFGGEVSNNAKIVTVRAKDQTVESILQTILAGTEVKFRLTETGQILLFKEKQNAEQKGLSGNITGRVLDSATGKAISGVTVAIVATQYTTVTNANGVYALRDVPIGEYQVAFKMLGYGTVTRKVKVQENQSTSVNPILRPVANILSGVVTTATGQQRKIEVGNDIVRINADSIMRSTPINNLSELLNSRVPGMTVTRTSGAPGAPSKIRIRGTSSMNATNDPIIILDGIRMYSTQARNGAGVNLTPLIPSRETGTVDRSQNMVAAATHSNADRPLVSSPIDQIDPHSIETVEVLKGPSAVALYGIDAANGVIVITTKRGQVGPPKWNAGVMLGTETVPGKWPTNYWMWGTAIRDDGTYGDNRIQCTVLQSVQGLCRQDSLVKYQILNDPHTSAFGRGSNNTYTAEVYGGTDILRYTFTGTFKDQLGYAKMPDADVKMLQAAGENPPLWQRRPLGMESQSGTIRIDASLGGGARVAFTHGIHREMTRTTPLTDAIRMSNQIPPAGQSINVYPFQPQEFLGGSGLLQVIPDYQKRISTEKLTNTSAVTAEFPFASIFNLHATAGINIEKRDDLAAMKRGVCKTCSSTQFNLFEETGLYNTAQGSAMVNTVNMRLTMAQQQLGSLLSIRPSMGINYVRTMTNDLAVTASDIAEGATSINGAKDIRSTQYRDERRNAGAYAEVMFGIANRFYVPLALRRDGGSGVGSGVFPTFPRLSFSYLVSDQPGFKRIPIVNRLSTLRFRTAYGQAAQQPAIASKLRLYSRGTVFADGANVPSVNILTAGNPSIRAERSKEVEGGIDLGMAEERVRLAVTFSQKNTDDAFVKMDLPWSLGDLRSYSSLMNVGKVRSRSFELDMETTILDNRIVTWTANPNYSSSSNILTYLGRSAVDAAGNAGFYGQRFVQGYPLNGRWGRPIVSYGDFDGNGVVTKSEIALSDSMVYLGAPEPKYEANLHSNLRLWNRVTINVSFQYKHGVNQLNESLRDTRYALATNDPTLPIAAQVKYLAAGDAYTIQSNNFGLAQTVSFLRFNSLSTSVILPPSWSQKMRTNKQITVGLSGSNLGLFTNYKGKDPDVSSSMGDEFRDGGAFPSPRSWQISIRIN